MGRGQVQALFFLVSQQKGVKSRQEHAPGQGRQAFRLGQIKIGAPAEHQRFGSRGGEQLTQFFLGPAEEIGAVPERGGAVVEQIALDQLRLRLLPAHRGKGGRTQIHSRFPGTAAQHARLAQQADDAAPAVKDPLLLLPGHARLAAQVPQRVPGDRRVPQPAGHGAGKKQHPLPGHRAVAVVQPPAVGRFKNAFNTRSVGMVQKKVRGGEQVQGAPQRPGFYQPCGIGAAGAEIQAVNGVGKILGLQPAKTRGHSRPRGGRCQKLACQLPAQQLCSGRVHRRSA